MTYTHRLFRYLPLGLLLLVAARLVEASPGTDAYAAGDLDRAAELLEAEIRQDDDPEKRKLLGIIAMSDNQFSEAYEIFDALAEDTPQDADIHYWLGASAGSLAANVSLFRAAGYARKTRKAFLRAIELDPQHVAAHLGLISYYLQAPGMLGGDKDEAIALSEKLTVFAPVDGKLQQAAIYADINQPEKAREVLTELAETHPNDPRALVRLGFYYQSDEDYAKAHEAFLRATTADDNGEGTRNAQLTALYQVGRTAVFSGERTDAGIAALSKYVEEPELGNGLPDIGWALFRLGQLQQLAGDDAAAQQSFAKSRAQTDDGNLLRELKKVDAGD